MCLNTSYPTIVSILYDADYPILWISASKSYGTGGLSQINLISRSYFLFNIVKSQFFIYKISEAHIIRQFDFLSNIKYFSLNGDERILLEYKKCQNIDLFLGWMLFILNYTWLFFCVILRSLWMINASFSAYKFHDSVTFTIKIYHCQRYILK